MSNYTPVTQKEGGSEMTINTPEQIAKAVADKAASAYASKTDRINVAASAYGAALAAIEADRAQRQPEIYIVQNDGGDVVGVFRDADEATAAHQDGYSVVEETVSEPGEYADQRIHELTMDWESATGDTAADYVLSEDDWAFGLPEDDAAEIARLIDWKKGNA